MVTHTQVCLCVIQLLTGKWETYNTHTQFSKEHVLLKLRMNCPEDRFTSGREALVGGKTCGKTKYRGLYVELSMKSEDPGMLNTS